MLEDNTGVQRLYIAYGLGATVLLWLAFGFGAQVGLGFRCVGDFGFLVIDIGFLASDIGILVTVILDFL